MPSKELIHQETHLQMLRLLQANPQINQRELAVALGISLGKTNFCLKALVSKSLLKMQNFRNSQRKLAYAYLLTPAGMAEKAVLTSRFLKRKMQEYELLKAEIDALAQEATIPAAVIPDPAVVIPGSTRDPHRTNKAKPL
jgi:EPS-associated MarR family transcriptional regulator